MKILSVNHTCLICEEDTSENTDAEADGDFQSGNYCRNSTNLHWKTNDSIHRKGLRIRELNTLFHPFPHKRKIFAHCSNMQTLPLVDLQSKSFRERLTRFWQDLDVRKQRNTGNINQQKYFDQLDIVNLRSRINSAGVTHGRRLRRILTDLKAPNISNMMKSKRLGKRSTNLEICRKKVVFCTWVITKQINVVLF